MAQMLLPIGGGDAVLDQRVGGRGVRNAQQRLGEAQQRDAFSGAKPIFREEVGDIGARLVRGARGADQCAGAFGDTRRRCGKRQ